MGGKRVARVVDKPHLFLSDCKANWNRIALDLTGRFEVIDAALNHLAQIMRR